MSLFIHKLQRFGLWLAGDEVRVIRAEEYARGYREGVTDGMAIEAQEQERREVERLPDVTPEPHDACNPEVTPVAPCFRPDGSRDHLAEYAAEGERLAMAALVERGEARVVDRL